MLFITLMLFSIFVIFQLLYLFVPLIKFIRVQPKIIEMQEQEPITILVPAFNEENIILSCLDGILQLNYANYEVIIINDGSTDNTLSILKRNLQLVPTIITKANLLQHSPIINCYRSSLFPRILVIDKINGGKADSLNAGIEYTSNEIIVTLDADCFLQSQAFHAINSIFRNKNIVAAGGVVLIIQGMINDNTVPSSTFNVPGLIKYQIVQYLTAFYLHKFTQAKFNAITVISGAFGIFRKSALNEINGYRNTIGEDMDITLRIHQLIRTRYTENKIVFIPEAVCYTECPGDFKDLFRQRLRWQKAFVDCIITYWNNLFCKFGFGISIYLFFDSLLLGTVSAFYTIIFLLTLMFDYADPFFALILISISVILGASQSIVSLIISQQFGYSYSWVDYTRYYLFSLIEVLSFRLLGLAFCTLGTIMYFFNKHEWNKVTRSGEKYTVNTDLTTCSDLQPISEKGEIL
ncbi:MAG: glycosyl transferase family 2 [Pelosinus sp.]|jgi:cellulose synthase/poly-beta-1,6-N-acetylglucosamine synthase-like glycosyltransferase|nr:glycosyl transferase family 2 [Pelosinus sp.]